jgi:Flp pilus assembly protein TadG
MWAHFKNDARGTARRRGSVSMIVALGLVVLLGFCALGVDYGVLANDANQLQRAADAAALAGAQKLPNPGEATTAAYNVAALNFVPNVSPNTVTVSVNSDNSKITVVCTRNRPLFFARVLGLNNQQLSRDATAGKPAMLPPRIVPIGVTRETLNAMKANPAVPRVLTYIRATDTPYQLDNFLVFDLRDTSAKSPTQMKNQLIAGAENVEIGKAYTSLNSSGDPAERAFKDALSTVFQNSSNAPWRDTWTGNILTSPGIRYLEIQAGLSPSDNPRVMRLVVNDPPVGTTPTGGGTTDFTVYDFAPVYVESWVETATERKMTVRYLDKAIGSGAPSGLVE